MYDPIEITKLFAFGTNSPSSNDYNKHIRPRGTAPASKSYTMSDYMTSGGGRFAYPSLFGAVKKFFNTTIADGTYTYAKIASPSLLNLSDSDLKLNISQYGTGLGSADHAERSYIFGNSPFELKTSGTTFEVIGGVKTIKGLEVRAINDNFDFESKPDSYSQYVNSFLLEPTFDPYELGRGPVTINFTGSGKTYDTYGQPNFAGDRAKEVNVNGSTASGIKSLIGSGGIAYFSNIASDPFLSYKRGNLKVIYGTPGNDNLDRFDSEKYLGDIFSKYLIVGGAGNDTLSGNIFADELQGGEGDDTLNGGLGDDTFIGGAGNDTMDGGSFLSGLFEGTDKSVYEGSLASYDVEFLSDDTVRISDKVGGRDGSDTLKGVDIAVFSDKSINLRPGQDLAFVIDTTGSMFDDIDAVKASASSIINAIFDGDRGFLDSRIAVVGYNDPDTNTFLSFTDQPKIDDRKTAAINAINSISVGGGGDFPEAVNAGLIRALSGGAGEWRSEAIARRIILFGDAPPNDNELRSQVLELASNVDVSLERSVMPMSIVGDIETSSLTNKLAVTRFAVTAADADGAPVTVPVEIFTILIGNDPTTSADFASLAAATGGEAFNAANAGEIVSVILEAIDVATQSPIALPDFAPTSSDTAVTIDILANDSDPNGDPLTVTKINSDPVAVGNQVTLASGALVTFNSEGTLTYDPNGQFDFLAADQKVTDTFSYTITDGKEGTDTATVSVELTRASNEILGTPGRDELIGTSNSDRIVGLQGADKLSGGSGNDSFIYNSIRDRGDTITDFEVGKDTIVLTQLLDSLVASGYNGTNAIVDGFVKVEQGSSSNNFNVQIDADGKTGADIFRPLIAVNTVGSGTLNNSANFIF
ncbi:Ig-like domain-containing protein [Scytonema sp. NUACC26]|uniref:Ig-like domain-containing protein n=1 Tax=Scytonema sp. NUACC26 TaxID=3140176 RepID=UPI0034DC47BE